jgi:hypothetical protein
MRMGIAALALGLATLGFASMALADDTPDAAGDSVVLSSIDDATFDAGFQCPETLADDDSREDALARYMAWAGLRHPDWPLRKRLDVRYGLLRRHSCAATLRNVAASALPAFRP